MASMRSTSFEISHFDQAIKSSVSKLGDKRIKEITSLQRKVILGFLKGRDTFACLPTGYGKSLIYQLAVRVAAELSVVYNYKDLFSAEPVVLVVSPLNALIKDQLSSCEKLGINATKIEGSELPSFEGTEIVYVSPETLIGNTQILLKFGERLLGIVVDESHCVNNWGFGSSPEKAPFRDAYSKIGNVRGFTRVPLLCLTATAAKKTRKQIIKTLYMKNVLFISKPPDKNNIKMSVHKLSQEEELETTFSWLTEELKTKKNRTSKTIIYCQSINACGELYSMMDSVLDGDAISNIAMFHSKTPEALKTKVLDNFVPMDGPVRVVVATTALGMGVNIPNVARVCHFGIPDTVEEYVQEIGRAGRDGRKSHGILYFKSYHLAHCDDSMKAFIRNPETKCRREMVAMHFKTKHAKVSPLHDCCDVCTEKCDCSLSSCKEGPHMAQPAITEGNAPMRTVEDDERQLLREVLQELKDSTNASGSIFGSNNLLAQIDDNLIKELVNSCEYIFTTSYLMENFAIFNIDTAQQILTVFADVFGDIEEVEFVTAMELSKFEEDDPLYLNHCYSEDVEEILSEDELSYDFDY